jgi:glycine betaine/proline transport system substrate-binding protein
MRLLLSATALVSSVAILGSFSSPAAAAADPAVCKQVRMGQPGWNDLAFTSGVASVLLNSLGYDAKSDLLGIEVIYKSLQDDQLDVFLGYWDPAMVSYYAPYKTTGSIDTVHLNLTGAKYTFAVPAYVYNDGVHDISDLHNFADKFDHKMYGIEPGSNDLMIAIKNNPKFDIQDWKVVQSSEQGMLAEVARAVKHNRFIVFQGWAPHPMNTEFDMRYLTGGDNYYGPDYGAATVSTQVRKGYVADCPNVGNLLQNLTFNIPLENKGMGFLINDGMTPDAAATRAIKEDPKLLDGWLAGVTTFDGHNGLAAVKSKLGLPPQ